MKLVTRFELAALSTPELLSLYSEVFNSVAGALIDNPDLRNGVASLANIRAEICSRA